MPCLNFKPFLSSLSASLLLISTLLISAPAFASSPLQLILQLNLHERSADVPLFDEKGEVQHLMPADSLISLSIDSELAADIFANPTILSEDSLRMLDSVIQTGDRLQVSWLEGHLQDGPIEGFIDFRQLMINDEVAIVGLESMSEEVNVTASDIIELESSFDDLNQLADQNLAALKLQLHNLLVDMPLNCEVEKDIQTMAIAFKGPLCRSIYITSKYGKRTSRKTKNGRRSSSFHQGIDFRAAVGTPIIAVADGCVARLLSNSKVGYGLAIYLSHKERTESLYAHMSKFKVKKGCVKRGDIIGYSGVTGNITGPHLHFGLKEKGSFVNPAKHKGILTQGTCNK